MEGYKEKSKIGQGKRELKRREEEGEEGGTERGGLKSIFHHKRPFQE